MYVSAAIRDLDPVELDHILTVARRTNAERSITGMLLYINGNFLQILEGAKEDVHFIFAHIKADWRHDCLRVLLDAPCEDRLFPDWTMGFDDLLPGDENRAGVFEATRAAIEGAIAPERARDIAVFLRTFYLINASRHAA